MDIWQHLFIDGEYAPREHILAGLDAEQAGLRPEGASHSIYQELWHTAHWQKIVLDRDEAGWKPWQEGESFPPSQAPESEESWQELVAMFLADLERAASMAAEPEMLAPELSPGQTMESALHSLTVHNAYHLGKIVSLRQRLGIWSPTGG